MADEQVIDDVSADIKAAMQSEEPEEEIITDEPEIKPARERDETGKFKAKEETVEQEPPAPAPAKYEPPVSYSAAMKAKWATLPEEVQAELSKREGDMHRAMTAQDGDLRMGREMKEVIGPYTPMLQAAGIQPKELISDIMNKVYVLNTGSPAQKAAVLKGIAQQYGIDMGAAASDEGNRIDPNIAFMQQQFQQLQQQSNPEVIKKQLREEMEQARIGDEIKAFEADPKNSHFATVKLAMGSLLQSGQAKDLQDAYDQACYANPAIRSTLLAEQAKDQETKRKAAMEAKRKAGASVNGSPTASPAPKAPTNSIEDDIRAAMQEARGVV